MHAEVRDHAGFRINSIKTTIINRLVRGQSIRFAGHLEDEYFAQLTSERKVVRYSRGQPIVRFERKVGAGGSFGLFVLRLRGTPWRASAAATSRERSPDDRPAA
jgi:hypothetical protein